MDLPLAPICFAVAIACSSLAQTQNPTPTIRVNVDLVSVNVRVTDKQNRYVPQLSANDFDLLEDGSKQKIAFFDTNKEPITLSVLVDSSSSMSSGGKLDAAQIMLGELMNSLRPEDEVSLMQFTDRIVSFEKVTWDLWPNALSSSATAESGGTALYDAVASALCRLREAKNLRQAIVVFTEGADQHGHAGAFSFDCFGGNDPTSKKSIGRFSGHHRISLRAVAVLHQHIAGV